MMYGNDVGIYVEVTIDNSHVIHTLADCSKHRVDRRQVLKGLVIESPKWLKGPHICLLNPDTKHTHFIPEHRIVEVNDKPIAARPRGSNLVYNVTSSKTGEVYIVRLNGMTRRWSCTCVGHQFHNKCRHTIKCELYAEKISTDSSIKQL
jgi:hypothetical protein